MATVLARYRHIECIPEDASTWEVAPRGAASMAENLDGRRDAARLYKELATLRVDVPLAEDLDDLRWKGVWREEYEALCDELGLARLRELPHKWAEE